MTTIELIRDWRRFSTGQRLEKTAAAAEILVARGYAVIVDDPSQPVKKKAAPKRVAKKVTKARATKKKSR